MKSPRGISLIELLIASALFSVVAMTGFQLISALTRRHEKVSSSVSVKSTLGVVLEELNRRIGNSVLLSPAEGLYANGDDGYLGVAGLNTAVGGCTFEGVDVNNERFSILRFTTFDYKISPTTTLRPWEDTDMATQEIRVVYHPDDTYPPHALQGPLYQSPEVFLIDADKVSMRRFKVQSVSTVTNSSLDPYDDLPKTIAGVPQVFNYFQVWVSAPPKVNGATQPNLGTTFITGSFLYNVHTNYLCKSPEGQIILKDEATGEVRSLFDPAGFNMTLDKMEFRFYGTKPTERLETQNFFLWPMTDPNKRVCVNNVLMHLELKGLDPNAKPDITEQLIPLATFNTRRPSGCL